jgi:hypothetical protein
MRSPINYVTAYEVSRHYGGPEEGGWWFDWYEPLATFPVTDQALVYELQAEVLERYADRINGDIYSVLGGVDVRAYLETTPFSHTTAEIPHYS